MPSPPSPALARAPTVQQAPAHGARRAGGTCPERAWASCSTGDCVYLGQLFHQLRHKSIEDLYLGSKLGHLLHGVPQYAVLWFLSLVTSHITAACMARERDIQGGRALQPPWNRFLNNHSTELRTTLLPGRPSPKKKRRPTRALMPVLSSFATSVARPGYWNSQQTLACLTVRSEDSVPPRFLLRHLGHST